MQRSWIVGLRTALSSVLTLAVLFATLDISNTANGSGETVHAAGIMGQLFVTPTAVDGFGVVPPPAVVAPPPDSNSTTPRASVSALQQTSQQIASVSQQ